MPGHQRRLKRGVPSTPPPRGPELRALRRLQRNEPASPYVFTSERRGPLSDATVRDIVPRAGLAAGLGFPVHPHKLRHASARSLSGGDGRLERLPQVEGPEAVLLLETGGVLDRFPKDGDDGRITKPSEREDGTPSHRQAVVLQPSQQGLPCSLVARFPEREHGLITNRRFAMAR